jgi:hypothetical protein
MLGDGKIATLTTGDALMPPLALVFKISSSASKVIVFLCQVK